MRKFVYPLQYDYLVRQYAYEDKVDPALVASVILVESKFDERAASQPGAHGLMQVMPDTAQWIADEMGMTDYVTIWPEDGGSYLKTSRTTAFFPSSAVWKPGSRSMIRKTGTWQIHPCFICRICFRRRRTNTGTGWSTRSKTAIS